jgi:hypothetical protein
MKIWMPFIQRFHPNRHLVGEAREVDGLTAIDAAIVRRLPSNIQSAMIPLVAARHRAEPSAYSAFDSSEEEIELLNLTPPSTPSATAFFSPSSSSATTSTPFHPLHSDSVPVAHPVGPQDQHPQQQGQIEQEAPKSNRNKKQLDHHGVRRSSRLLGNPPDRSPLK